MPMKYAAQIGQIEGCPPRALVRQNRVAYRFVFSDINNPNNFIPPALIKPGRFVSSKSSICCSAYALSMYDSMEQLIARAKASQKSNPLLLKRIGDHVATLNVAANDGDCSQPNGEGHFDLFEDANFSGVAAVVRCQKLEL